MIVSGTEYFPMVAIFIPLEYTVFAGFKIGVPLKDINNLSVGDNIVTMISREIS